MQTDAEIKLVRRLTWRLLPFLMLCFMTAYLDRVNIGYAALTMQGDLGLTGADYGLAAGLFFVTYFALELPSNLAVLRFGPRRWFARIMVSWGLLSAAMALVTGAKGFYLLRLLLGAAEAGFVPGVIFYLSTWFPQRFHARVLGLFLVAGPVAGVIGGPLSSALLSLDGQLGLRGWQWLFVGEGLPAVVLGIATLRLLPDRPSEAPWLSREEVNLLQSMLEADRPVQGVHREGVGAAFRQPALLGLAFVYFAALSVNYMLGFFLPQFIKSLGASTAQIGLLTTLPYLAGIVAQLTWPALSDRANRHVRFAMAALALATVAVIAAGALSRPEFQVAALIAAGAGVYGFTPTFWSVPPKLFKAEAAAAGIAVINSVGNLAGLATPWFIGATHDATGSYVTGMWAVGGLSALGLAVLGGVGRAKRLR